MQRLDISRLDGLAVRVGGELGEPARQPCCAGREPLGAHFMGHAVQLGEPANGGGGVGPVAQGQPVGASAVVHALLLELPSEVQAPVGGGVECQDLLERQHSGHGMGGPENICVRPAVLQRVVGHRLEQRQSGGAGRHPSCCAGHGGAVCSRHHAVVEGCDENDGDAISKTGGATSGPCEPPVVGAHGGVDAYSGARVEVEGERVQPLDARMEGVGGELGRLRDQFVDAPHGEVVAAVEGAGETDRLVQLGGGAGVSGFGERIGPMEGGAGPTVCFFGDREPGFDGSRAVSRAVASRAQQAE